MAAVKFTRQQVAARNHRNDAAIIIDNVVYDVTKFLDDHPGTAQVLLENAGKDASQFYHEVGHDSDIAIDWAKKFVAGEVVDEDRWEVRTRTAVAAPEAEAITFGGLLCVWGPLVLVGLAALLYNFLFP